MFQEFKNFIARGNALDMAIGIIIGAAFGKIVDSLVKDIIMPPLGLLLNGVDFSNLFFILKEGATKAPYASLEAAKAAGAVTINIGFFINTLISFIIIAFSIFLLLKIISKLKHLAHLEEEKQATTDKKCPYCCSSINLEATRCPHCTSTLD
ncbi:large conductance mechanosensitive channel protein MscL [Campylobacter sp. MIT 12-8780]|uniref:large conductance mechanosensitive channel protein MscL n=1 Tax=Campylobacter sp. MIT 12-8780 TaxID=2202200 RepID=UPI00115D7C57|nr:large conductance mechanosensitive channel protein MscL [Campylobacter sp. MIT 12-8780]TQR40473.1 large conductance mechanosensitive channel protein MscL [Campylobacter sp. MIT 12-8780]